MIDELSVENEGVAKIGKVNIGNEMDLAIQYQITGVPTIMVFKGGQMVEKQLGAPPKQRLQQLIAQHQ